jgi:hypothetical protein
LDAFQCERTALALSTSSRSALKALVCVLFRVRVKLLFTLVLRTPDGMVRDCRVEQGERNKLSNASTNGGACSIRS